MSLATLTVRHGFDPPPRRKGQDLIREGNQWKRTMLLWDADSDFHEERRGVRVFFRHSLVSRGVEIAETRTDDQIRGLDG